jgi:hypothetical protein
MKGEALSWFHDLKVMDSITLEENWLKHCKSSFKKKEKNQCNNKEK